MHSPKLPLISWNLENFDVISWYHWTFIICGSMFKVITSFP